MNEIDEAIEILIDAIKSSEEYIQYQKMQEKVDSLPELSERINAYRQQLYRMQNSQGTVDIYEETDRLTRENEEFRKNEIVFGYLEAECTLCRVVQKVNWTLIEELDFDAGLED